MYEGIDYLKTVDENIKNLFNGICIELVKSNEILLNKAKEITKKHIEIMYERTKETDKEREFPFTLNPTWKEMKDLFDSIIQ